MSTEYDSLSIFAGAQFLSERLRWGGIIVPFFPLFFLPEKNGYRDDPYSLIVYLNVISNDSLIINPNSFKVKVNDTYYSPTSFSISDDEFDKPFQYKTVMDSTDLAYARDGMMFKLEPMKLKFPLNAFEIDNFELFVNGIYMSDKNYSFPVIKFIKTEQRTFIFGP
jgi:hypothetical protein